MAVPRDLSSRIASVAALVGLVASTTGCDDVFGLERGPGCGDGTLLLEEDCDDGNSNTGDGCGRTCQIEPNFECPVDRDVCLPVLALWRGPVDSQLASAGSPKSTLDFTFECPAGAVVIGFEGYADGAAGNLGRINALCGTLALAPDGSAVVTRSSESGFIGSTSNTGGLLTVTCGENEVAVGWGPITNDYVAGFTWSCQAVSHTGGELRFGATRSMSFGLAGLVEPVRQCPTSGVVTQMSLSTGTSVDLMGLGCSPLYAAVCGDGDLTAPETCDDGNLARRDGCDAQCLLE